MFKKANINKMVSEAIKSITRMKLEEFRNYTQELESKFNADKVDLEMQYKESTEGLTDDDLYNVENFFSESYHDIENVYIVMYRKSTLVSLYTLLETSLNSLCIHLKRINNYPISVGDLRGEGVVRSVDYLQKLANVDIEAINATWSRIQAMNKLRNCIVHCDGKISSYKSKKSVVNIANNNEYLSLIDEKTLKIEREYIDKTINEVESFLDFVYSKTLDIT